MFIVTPLGFRKVIQTFNTYQDAMSFAKESTVPVEVFEVVNGKRKHLATFP